MCEERVCCGKCGKDMDSHKQVVLKNGESVCRKKILRKFCSKECAGTKKVVHIVICENCKKEFQTTPDRRDRKYCSKTCFYQENNNCKKYQIWKYRDLTKPIVVKEKICPKCNIKHKGFMKKCKSCVETDFKIRERKRSIARGKIRKQFFRQRKRILVYFAGGKCKKCGYCKCPSPLSFHHIDPNEKKSTICSLMSKKWEIILGEINKCELLCANCHAKLHQEERDNIKANYNKIKYVARKLKYIQELGGECKLCKYTFDVSNLQIANFHHLSDKKFPLDCDAFYRKQDDELRFEISKCELLCSNCHHELHYFKQ